MCNRTILDGILFRQRTGYRALLVTGVLCGLAGAYLSTALSAGFDRDMTAGGGYLALAAVIFANWRPFPTCSPACCSASWLRAARDMPAGVRVFSSPPLDLG